jgi:transcriptional regulator with XRE-family HTH domain
MDFVEVFAANLVRCRKLVSISQEELGFRASLHRTEIGMLENAERLPRIDTLVKLCGALQVEPSVLLKGLSWEAGETRVGHFEFGGTQEGDRGEEG